MAEPTVQSAAPARKRASPRARAALSVDAVRDIEGVQSPRVDPVDVALLMLVPSLGRPGSVGRMVEAWRATGGFDRARLAFVVDPGELAAYRTALDAVKTVGDRVTVWTHSETGLVARLNGVSREIVAGDREGVEDIRHVGFMGDDHLPRTAGWTGTYVEQLDELVAQRGAGMVYPQDGLQGENLATSWALSLSWVRAINRMVPALVVHMFCDNAVLDLAKAAGVARYLPDVLVEHMHPIAKKAPVDSTYRRTNTRAQMESDRRVYDRWSRRPEQSPRAGLVNQAARLMALRP